MARGTIFHDRPWENPAVWRVMDRDGGTTKDHAAYLACVRADPCGICGGPSSELDHVTAKSAGGPDRWSNRAAICSGCNARKHSLSLLGFLLWRAAMLDRDKATARMADARGVGG